MIEVFHIIINYRNICNIKEKIFVEIGEDMECFRWEWDRI